MPGAFCHIIFIIMQELRLLHLNACSHLVLPENLECALVGFYFETVARVVLASHSCMVLQGRAGVQWPPNQLHKGNFYASTRVN